MFLRSCTTRATTLLVVLAGVTLADDTTVEGRMEKRCREYAEYVFETIEDPILLPGTKPKKVDNCKINTQVIIVGGTNALPEEFPHMALIGYGTRPTYWRCGGSLISELWVMTAAHCITPDLQPELVRLGDLDLLTHEDKASPEDFRIVQSVNHPNYTAPQAYNDIALLKLDRPVWFNSFIRPACLHGIPSSENAIVSGWGATSYGSRGSTYLQKVGLDIVGNDECRNKYPQNTRGLRKVLPGGVKNESQICAWAEGKDSCQGDSGGPLQQVLSEPYCMYSVIGVTSIGNKCGGKLPGIYTRVANYLPWIESVVWPQPDGGQAEDTQDMTTQTGTIEEVASTTNDTTTIVWPET